MSFQRRLWTALAVASTALCLLPSAAGALEFDQDKTKLELLDAAGEPEVRAGSHPDRLVQAFSFVSEEGADGDPREMVIDLPAGLSGSQDAVVPCPREVFGVFPFEDEGEALCPESSRVGTFYTSGNEELPLFEVQPGSREAAVFGTFNIVLPIRLIGTLRPDDQGLSLRFADIPQKVSDGGRIELWGVPADHQQGTEIPRRPLLTTPTRCDGQPLQVTLRARSWAQPETWKTIQLPASAPLADCRALPFEPSVEFSLGDSRSDAPTGADVEVQVPQEEGPEGRASSMVRGLSILMPPGLSVSAGGAAGLSACGDAAFGLGEPGDATCPASSRIGSVELEPAGGAEPLRGDVYLGAEHPGDRYRVLLAASAPGAIVKLAGSLQVDSRTGRVKVDLADLPQAAFDSLRLSFSGGPRSLLATPLDCGPAATRATITPYSGGAPVDWSGSVKIEQGGGRCGPAPFAPSVAGGSSSALAGGATAFSTTIRRRDGEQLPARMAIELPPGLSAAVGRVDACGAAAAQAGLCGPESRIGSAVAELGPGEHPARIEGDLYLTAPYRGAPFGIALVFGAKLGPFDLGTLVVRGALRIDSNSGQVAVEMASLPTVFEGLPVRFQMIGLDLDRPGFMRNPTSCSPSQVSASLRSREGTATTSRTPFLVHGCIALPLRPRLSAALGGRGQLRAGGHPSLRLALRMPAGGTNLRSIAVRFPSPLAIASPDLQQLCSRRRAEQGRCPKDARIGTASARTSLLAGPMKGSLYLVQPEDEGTPDIWASLSGQDVQINLPAQTEVRHGRAETRFTDLPDFPLRSLVLRLRAGEGGVLKLKSRPCGALRASARFTGQNRATAALRPRLLAEKGCRADG
ncbi:MAG TPA: hypothetical protein VFJ99_04790 [Solirubrobacterales bacterium]|nr:hypothetical protein [Solirubrobacterales bacterium]